MGKNFKSLVFGFVAFAVVGLVGLSGVYFATGSFGLSVLLLFLGCAVLVDVLPEVARWKLGDSPGRYPWKEWDERLTNATRIRIFRVGK